MAGNVALVMDILARDKASKTLKDVGTTADTTGGKLHGIGTKAKVGMVAAAGALGAFGKKSVDTFQNVGKETLKLQRSIGGTAEEASRLRFAAQETGTDIDVFTKGMGLLSKNLVGAGDKTKLVTSKVEVATGAWRKQTTIIKDAAGHFQTVSKMVPVMKIESMSHAVRVVNPLVKQLGINVRDSAGHIRPMGDLLPEIAEKFKSMPAGAEKTALAMKLFGKNGVAMLPFLNKGAEGIKDLEHESDKLGNTLSGKDLQAVKDNTKAKREWHAAIQGVQIQLGRNLFPILTKGATILAQVASFVERNGAVMKPLILFVATLAAGVKAWTIAQAALNTVMAMNPIGLVVIAVAALAAGLIYAYKHSETFRNIVQTAFAVVRTAGEFLFNFFKNHWPLLLGILTGPIGLAVGLIIKHWDTLKAAASFLWDKVLRPTFKFIVDAWLSVAGAIIHGAASAFGWVPGIGPKLKAAAKEFDKFRDQVNASIDGVHKNIHVTIDAYYKAYGANAQGVATNAALHGRATGGPVTAGQPYIVGEHEPELFVPGATGRIYNSRQIAGTGGDIYIDARGATADAAPAIVTALRRYKRELGGGELGLA